MLQLECLSGRMVTPHKDISQMVNGQNHQRGHSLQNDIYSCWLFQRNGSYVATLTWWKRLNWLKDRYCWWERILHHLECINLVNSRIKYLSTHLSTGKLDFFHSDLSVPNSNLHAHGFVLLFCQDEAIPMVAKGCQFTIP